ncbi:uncharacterized protein LOC131654918 [Vicia villosa]|uniref:uncharacterized protein LOC131654918 n=1 Tax=Vicia villosa TaxID=3911 RepID=UPI00273B359A|nr:uncharacterized protein LOC131654918 [Vicia villosa]
MTHSPHAYEEVKNNICQKQVRHRSFLPCHRVAIINLEGLILIEEGAQGKLQVWILSLKESDKEIKRPAVVFLHSTNKTKKKQNYDPINFETLGDHSNWVLEDSPPFLTIEEVEALRKDLASMTIQPISNDIDELNLDEVDVEGDAPLNSGENNQSNNIIDGEDVANAIDFVGDGFDIEGDPNIEIILPPWN